LSFGSALARPEKTESSIPCALHRKRDVFERREARQHRGDLERAREAEAGARVDWQRR